MEFREFVVRGQQGITHRTVRLLARFLRSAGTFVIELGCADTCSKQMTVNKLPGSGNRDEAVWRALVQITKQSLQAGSECRLEYVVMVVSRKVHRPDVQPRERSSVDLVLKLLEIRCHR